MIVLGGDAESHEEGAEVDRVFRREGRLHAVIGDDDRDRIGMDPSQGADTSIHGLVGLRDPTPSSFDDRRIIDPVEVRLKKLPVFSFHVTDMELPEGKKVEGEPAGEVNRRVCMEGVNPKALLRQLRFEPGGMEIASFREPFVGDHESA